MLANESNRLWVAIFDGALGRISVPLFMVVSAFLLVPVKTGTTMTDFYKRRFKRILPPMLVFMLLYCFMPLLWGGLQTEQAWQDFIYLPFTFPSSAGHLWFMYPLISLYLIIPIVSAWLEKSSAKDERFFLSNIAPLFIPEGPGNPILPIYLTIPHPCKRAESPVSKGGKR